MYSLEKLGLKECYMLDNDRIYNTDTKKYVKGIGEFRYRLTTKDGKRKCITMKEIYKKLFDKVFCIDNIEPREGEEYREIKGTGGNYFISNFGSVKSYMGNYAKILKPTITPKGYERLQIVIDGERYNKFVHILVAEMWLPQPSSIDCEIHHIDCDCSNSNVNNLVYLTKAEHRKIHNERRRNEQ